MARTRTAALASSKRTVLGQLIVSLAPALFISFVLAVTYQVATAPEAVVDTTGLTQSGSGFAASDVKGESTGLVEAQESDQESPGRQGTAG